MISERRYMWIRPMPHRTGFPSSTATSLPVEHAVYYFARPGSNGRLYLPECVQPDHKFTFFIRK
jgi:hypothetical protein